MSRKNKITTKQQIWSATPTPLTEKMTIDGVSVRHLVQHHVKLGVQGLFLAGSCGEGPWITPDMRDELIERTVKANKGRMVLAAQVTDNSWPRIVENMKRVAEAGADIAVIAAPHFARNLSPSYHWSLYYEAIRRSPLPVGIYDLGDRVANGLPLPVLRKLLQLPEVVMLKDSSLDPERRKAALAARKKRNGALRLMNGNEWEIVTYAEAGYDGHLLGGGIFNAAMARRIVAAVEEGDLPGAGRLQKRLNVLQRAVYGGSYASLWLGGLKFLLKEMGVFRTDVNLVNYHLNERQRTRIRKALDDYRSEMVTS